MDETERRQALAAFLRTRRARLQPAEVGLPSRHVLQNLARALRLTTAEEQHLFLLASQE